MADRDTASGPLGLVQAFVNSVDLEQGPEQLRDAAGLGTWLANQGLLDDGAIVEEADLRHAIALREAVQRAIACLPSNPPS